jgi:transcription elongation factor Elf1
MTYYFSLCLTYQNAIDLDQAEIEDQLAIGSDISFEKARRIYEDGGHSKSVAMVKLSTPINRALAKFTAVSGETADGVPVYGKLFDNYPNGSNIIEIQYKTKDQQKSYVGCQVGGLPKPNLDGCFVASGTFSIDGDSVNYTYDPKTQNVNIRTIKGFSTSAEEKMFRCSNCPYDTFKKFREYYGFFDYSDKWIDAAFDGKGTVFARGNGEFVENILSSIKILRNIFEIFMSSIDFTNK